MPDNANSARSSLSDKVIAEEFNRLRGRLAGLIESWGLKDSQERGAISTLKLLTYDAEKRFKDLL